MSNSASQPPDASSNAGCGPGLMMTLGVILLLPGLCTIGVMVSFGRHLNQLPELWPLWIACLAISTLGVYLLYAAEKSRRGEQAYRIPLQPPLTCVFRRR